jgi:hypothetical protein
MAFSFRGPNWCDRIKKGKLNIKFIVAQIITLSSFVLKDMKNFDN